MSNLKLSSPENVLTVFKVTEVLFCNFGIMIAETIEPSDSIIFLINFDLLKSLPNF